MRVRVYERECMRERVCVRVCAWEGVRVCVRERENQEKYMKTVILSMCTLRTLTVTTK